MKIFITGATGFIGKRLAERLIEEKHEIICAGRSLEKLKNLSGKAKLTYLELEDSTPIQNILRKEKPDILYHCAALVKRTSLQN